MPIPADLRELLACPQCKGELEYPDDETVRCASCRLVYRVADEVPVLLVDEATPYEKTSA